MAQQILRAEALFDFQPTADVELQLKKGDVVTVRRTSVGEGWWEGELNGKRGLFPSSFVKMLPLSQGSPVKEQHPKTPITPRTSKKLFMDALLAPATLTQEPVYDRDKAADIFVPGYADISITVGPSWDCNPPELTVAIRHMQTESRFSGIKHTMVYEVETEQLGTCVARRYKHFLWLYDRMAELFPCLSLPPLPVKHFSGLSEGEAKEATRKGLEKFLVRIARHPVLASTKLFREFLTAKDEKDWKIGRHLSKILKSKKMFASPFFFSVKYPPFNVPVHQLSSIEKFSRFSRFMEATVHTLHQSCNQLTTLNGDSVTCICMLGRDLQRFSTGQQPASGAWIVAQKRKHAAALATAAVNGPSPFHVTSVAPQKVTGVAMDADDGSSDEDTFDVDAQWNWREDKRFAQMAENLHDLSGRMRKFKPLVHRHHEAMDRQVQDTLDDYSGIIHTLPMLVKLHEDAMELFNSSREKDTRKDAEEIRQHCDTLNNILLAEFDYFSKMMADDFELMIVRLLKQQADFHRRLADELEALYHNYTSRTSTTEEEGRDSYYRSSRSTSGSKEATSFLKSGSIDLTSSQESTSSDLFQRTPTREHCLETSQTSQTSQVSVQTLTIHGSETVPNYINVELKTRKAESSGSEIDEDLLLPPGERGKIEADVGVAREPSPPPPVINATIPTHFDDIIHFDPPTPFDDDDTLDYDNTVTEQDNYSSSSSLSSATADKDDKERTTSYPNYANLEFAQVHNLLPQVPKPMAPSEEEATSPKGPKKPMPIQRKTKSMAASAQCVAPQQTGEGEEVKKSVLGSPVRTPLVKKPAPPVKPPNLLNQEGDSSTNLPKFKRTLTPNSSASSSSISKSTSPLPALSKFLTSSTEGKTKDNSQVSTGSSVPPASSSKPRSQTNVERLFSTTPSSPGDKKQPILPPPTRYRSKSRSPSPVITPVNTQPSSKPFMEKSNEEELSILALATLPQSSFSPTVHKPALKAQKSEPAVVRNRPLTSTPPALTKVNKPAFTSYGSKFPRTLLGGASTAGNSNSSSSSSSNSEMDELMKKLTLRRKRIDEQLAVTKSGGTSSSYTTTKTSSPVPRPSPPSLSPQTSHRASVPLSHKSSTTISSSSLRSGGEISSERNSTISTSSSSEVVVTYRKLDESPSLTSLSSNGTTYSLDGGGSSGVLLRKPDDTIETNLAKYGIIEEGGSYVI